MTSNSASSRVALRGDLLDFTAEPGCGDVESTAVRFRPDHWLLIEDGRIVGAQAATQPLAEGWPRHDHRGRLIMPGFIDSHVHSPQLDVIASYGTELLDWLEHLHLPGRDAATPIRPTGRGRRRSDSSMRCWPTARPRRWCSRPCTRHRVDALFAAAQRARHAPHHRQGADGPPCARRTARRRGPGRARLRRPDRALARQGPAAYAVTARFAPTSTPAQLGDGGRAVRRATRASTCRPTWPRTATRCAGCAELFPEARSYLDVYARARPAATGAACSAHGVWLDDDDRALLRDTGAQIAHCPSSNLFLGSGLFDWRAAERRRRRGQPGHRRRRRHQPVDAAHDGRRLQGAGAGRASG